MTHHASPLLVRVSLLALAAASLCATAAAGKRGPDCLTLEQNGATDALSELRPILRGREEVRVELAGLKAINEQELWTIAAADPREPLDVEEAAALLARLRETGLFARIDPKLDGDVLRLSIVENPVVKRVEIRGLTELPAEDLIGALLREPWTSLRSAHADDDDQYPRCAPPDPPREWVARWRDQAVQSGVLYQGLPPALRRLARHLEAEGYLLSSFTGSLDADGTLEVDVDEGRLEHLELRGVHPSIRADVRRELRLRTGEPFSIGALRAGLDRVRKKWPFLHADGSLRAEVGEPRVALEDEGGEVRFHTLPPAPVREERRRFDDEWQLEDLFGDDAPWTKWRGRAFASRRARAVEVEGGTLRLRLRSDRAKLDADFTELIRHTQVTGFAPGLPVELRLWDPGDRAHLVLDGLIGINSKRPGRTATEDDLFGRMAASERLDWLLGAKLEVPSLRIVEVGGQLHALTDTSDRWRISRLDSYLSSMLFSRPESEYYRRAGAEAFVTAHFDQRVTLGAEYRLDCYSSLDAVKAPVLFNRDDQPYANAPIDAGLMRSVVLRAEWSSEPVDPRKTRNPWRAPETSLFARDLDEPGLRSFVTVEIAGPALGGDFKFVKLVSDTNLMIETGRHETLRLRARVAGGTDLPLQKQEALGGWEALRGYDFKELRGEWSLLGTIQYEISHWGAFADVGSVKQGTRFSDPSLGLGALFRIDDVRLETAWRTDQRARLAPELRLLFQRAF